MPREELTDSRLQKVIQNASRIMHIYNSTVYQGNLFGDSRLILESGDLELKQDIIDFVQAARPVINAKDYISQILGLE